MQEVPDLISFTIKIQFQLIHIFLSELFIEHALVEKLGKRLEITLVAGDHEVLAYKDIQFAGRRYAVGLIEDGEVQDDKEVGIIIVDLGSLHAAEHVIQCQSVEVEIIGQVLDLAFRGLFDIVPGQLAVAADRVDITRICIICYLHRYYRRVAPVHGIRKGNF